MSTKTNLNSECCPRFDPTSWNEKTFNWENKKFIKDKVFTLFYMPINFGAVITRLTNKVQKQEQIYRLGYVFQIILQSGKWKYSLLLIETFRKLKM